MNIELPNRKVSVAGVTGAVLTVLFAVLSAFDIVVSAEAGAAAATIASFLLAYFVKEPA